MSQEGIVDVIGNNPQIPTTFDADVGSATPILNTIEFLGEVVLAGVNPFRSIGSGNTITYQVQTSQAIAAADPTKLGLSVFNSSDFSVDADGFVSLLGPAALAQFNVDAATPPGTDPVVPDGSGMVTVTGGQVAAGTTANVIQTNSLAANTYTIQVQRASAQAVSTVGANGVAHFSSAMFSLDGNGFVTLLGGGQAVDSFSPDSGTDPVVPTAAGLVNLKGSGSITTVGSLNTITTELTGLTNHSVLVGAGTTTITKLAVGTNGQVLIGATAADPAFATLTSSDSSITFTTGANSLSLQVTGGTSVLKTLTGDTGGAISPTAGNINTLGTGSITIAGAGSTLTTQLTGLTNHNVLVGAGTATITKVAPSATSGVPLISQGAAADPAFGTAVVAGGGTGATSLTANSLLLGNGTSPISALGAATNGQLPIGSTGASPVLATLTQGSGITITNGAGSITIAAAAGTGDVVGPGSSTDNALVRFDGTTGKLIQNGVITEDDTGNLSISASVSGASLSALVANTSNTASATAFYNAQVAGSTAADPYYKAEISGGQAWTMGLDNSDSDAFVISASATPGTTNIMRSATSGEINYPLQPAFLGTLGTNDSDVTGNGATYTLGSGNALTEIFDQNGDFVTSGTFTAPVTGRYFLASNFVMAQITSAMTFYGVNIATSNRTYTFFIFNAAAMRTVAVAADVISGGGCVLADMDAADTFTTNIAIHGGAGNTADTLVSSGRIFMCGNLVC